MRISISIQLVMGVAELPHGKENVIVMCEHLLLVVAFVLTALMCCENADGNDDE